MEDNKSTIKIVGAREHNLKNIDIEIPRNKITCLVGVSGSGKSTIAIDIIASEGQRQYLKSLNTYATKFLSRIEKPDIDGIEGLSTAILVEQRPLGASSRSTVGTVTEIYTYLRLLFSRIGSIPFSAGHFSFNNPKGACYSCKGTGIKVGVNVDRLVDFDKSLNDGAVKHSNYNRPSTRLMNILKTTGCLPFNVPLKDLTKKQLNFLLYSPHIKLKNSEQGFIQSYSWEGIANRLIRRRKDLRGVSKGKKKKDGSYITATSCTVCKGSRLDKKVLKSTINSNNIGYYANLPITKLLEEIKKIDDRLARSIQEVMVEKLQALLDVGMGYVSLNRSINTLSGGESQRVKLARELNTDLIEMIYVLDEPTAGLHAKNIHKLVDILRKLRDCGNTVIVVEHDKQIMETADYLVEIGPKAGRNGGKVIYSGVPDIFKTSKTLTANYLMGVDKIEFMSKHRTPSGYLKIQNANIHNLKNIGVRIPTGVFTVVTGVSGSGKSTLISDIFVKKYIDKVVFIDQSLVGANIRGCIATYQGVFDHVRMLMAKASGMRASQFSSNSTGGCLDCKGLGFKKIDMHFMPDVKMTCETCGGKKYIKEVLGFKYKSKNIYEILQMTVEQAQLFFKTYEIVSRLKILKEVGLDYLSLGQTLDTLSGGESQRLKLANRLHKKGEFYVLDEPTSGLHFEDIKRLLRLLHNLVDNGNSVLVIEHNLDVIKSADWIIDLGLEGGDEGGEIIAEGTPEAIARVERSYTGQYLKKVL